MIVGVGGAIRLYTRREVGYRRPVQGNGGGRRPN